MTKSQISVLRYCFGYKDENGKSVWPKMLITKCGSRLHLAAKTLAESGIVTIHGMGPLSMDVRIAAATEPEPMDHTP